VSVVATSPIVTVPGIDASDTDGADVCCGPDVALATEGDADDDDEPLSLLQAAATSANPSSRLHDVRRAARRGARMTDRPMVFPLVMTRHGQRPRSNFTPLFGVDPSRVRTLVDDDHADRNTNERQKIPPVT
jgi:hypothetical protein